MDLKSLIENAVADAMGKLDGLTKTITLRCFVSDGVYDPETDTTNPVYEDQPGIVCVAAKPTFQDVENYAATFAQIKLIVPGKGLTRIPENDTDKAVIDGVVWNIKKVIEVPGRSVFLIFVDRT